MRRITKRLSVLAVILVASPALAKSVAITGVALDQSGAKAPTAQSITMSSGETGAIGISVTHPDGTAFDLTGCQLLFSLQGATISRQATITNPANLGIATFPIVVADTVGLFGNYSYDVWLTDASGNRYQIVPASSFMITQAFGRPAQPVTVPSTQTPLAQGPTGPQGTAGLPNVIENSGTALTSRAALNFTGAGVSCVDNSGAARTDCTIAGGATYDPSIPVVLQVPKGAHVNHGMYYGSTAGVNIGTQWQYEAALAIEGDNNGYWWSDGYGGGHAMLAGYAGGLPTGNVWNGTSTVSFGGFDGVTADEWHVYSVSGDGADIYVHIDGVPVGAAAFSVNRVTCGAGCGSALVGGSDHSNLAMKIAWIRNYDTVDPLHNGCPYRPQWSPAPDYNYGASYPTFLADYTKPGAFIADASDGFNGHKHPGQFYHPADPTCVARGLLDIDLISGYYSCMTQWPLPKWIVDATAPFQRQTAPSSPSYSGSVPSTPVGAKIFDSFSRADNDLMWSAAPTLGSTESGSLGAKAWSTKVARSTNVLGQNTYSDWGIFKGRAVNLDCPGDGNFQALAWVMSDSPDMTVSADRNPLGSYDPFGNIDVTARVASDGSSFYVAQDYHGAMAVGYSIAGVTTWLVTGIAPTNEATYVTMSLQVSGSTITVKTDGVTQYTTTDTHVTTGNGAGMMRDPDVASLQRWDNFTVL